MANSAFSRIQHYMHHWRLFMKVCSLAAVAVLGSGLAAASTFAAIPDRQAVQDIIGSVQVQNLVQVASTSERDRKKRRNFNAGFSYRELGIIPGHVPTPYGYRDCIG